jgi:hypothetical protein
LSAPLRGFPLLQIFTVNLNLVTTFLYSSRFVNIRQQISAVVDENAVHAVVAVVEKQYSGGIMCQNITHRQLLFTV